MNIKKFSFALLTTVATVAILTALLYFLGLTLVNPKKPSLSVAYPTNTLYLPAQNLGFLRYQFSPHFTGKEWNTNFSINSFGFRGPEFEFAKPANTIRVLCLGDSCTFGTGGLADSDTYPVLLEGLLNKDQNARNFEVINAGMPGFSVYDGFILLKQRQLMNLKPDFIIICYGWNDHMGAAINDNIKSYKRLINTFIWQHVRFHSLLWYILTKKYKNSEVQNYLEPKNTYRVTRSQYEYYLSKIIDLAGSNNSKVLVMTAPWEPRLMSSNVGWLIESTLVSFYLHPAYVNLTKKVSYEKGAVLIDLYLIYESEKTDNPRDFFVDPFHYNRNLAFMIAAEISRVIYKITDKAQL